MTSTTGTAVRQPMAGAIPEIGDTRHPTAPRAVEGGIAELTIVALDGAGGAEPESLM